MFKKVLYNTSAQIAGKAFTATSTMLVTVLIGRSLGPAGYGEFTKIFVFVAYFYTLADFGLNSIFIKITQGQTSHNNLRALLGLRLIIAAALVFSAITIGYLIPYNQSSSTGFSPVVKAGIAIASLTIITQALFTTANAYFQKILRYDLSTIASVASALTVLALAVIFYNSSSPLPYVSAYVFGGLALVLVAYWLLYRSTGRIITPILDTRESKKMFSLAWPIGAALVFNLIYFRIDVFILSNTRPTGEVGLYGLAYQFFEASLAVPIFFANAIYPLLSKIYAQNKDDFKKELKKWVFLMVLFSLLASVFLFLSSFLIPYIFGLNFTPSQSALRILSLGVPFFFLSALLWHVLIIYSKQKYLIPIYAAGAVFNLILNLLLIPKFGYLAAAAITVFSEAFILLLLIVSSYKIIREDK